jgi:phosphoribosylaminoimidazolecarboxamide formyltransferase/IMP cyclohydrolase
VNEKVKTALLSVTDKSGLQPFAKELHRMGIELIATGGSFKKIKEAGIPVKKIESITKFPEMLDGRVKTLHPKIHAGILADRGKKAHLAALKKQGIKPIDLVIVNLYQFKETIAKKNVSLQEAIENIDIGGPTLIRAAAKNYESVAVVTSPDQYLAILAELKKNNGCISLEKRKELAGKAFELTAAYDATVARFIHNKFLSKEKFPERLSLSFEKIQDLRYGENWHQEAAFYKDSGTSTVGIGDAEQLHGKDLSFNNINDANAAIELAREFDQPTAVIIKHANPCGVCCHRELSTAFKKALECDRTSAFGSIIALNRECDSVTAMQIASFFNEVVIAPSFEKTALEVLRKKKNLRVLRLASLGSKSDSEGFDFKFVAGGLLAQTLDSILLKEPELKIVSKRKPGKGEMQDLIFALTVAKHAKSNAVVLAKDNATVGVGAGQMSRIDSTEIAIKKSGGRHKGSVLASEAFFPFRDNVDLAAKAGITAIIQPGGSLRDEEVIEAADQHGLAMVFTAVRHFKH